MANPKKAPTVKDLGISYGNVSYGDALVTIGCKVARGNLSVAKADSILTGKQITCQLHAGVTADADPKQGRMFKDGDFSIEGVFQSKGFSVTAKRISFSLSIPIKSLPKGASPEMFAKREGRMELVYVEDIDESTDEDEGE